MEQAPGVLAFPGGKVEVEDGPDSVLEAAVRREVQEETGVTVAPELDYVRSVNFTMDDGTAVVDVLFHGAYNAGEPAITAPEEVADIRWMTVDEILAHERTPPWLTSDVELVEALRRRRQSNELTWRLISGISTPYLMRFDRCRFPSRASSGLSLLAPRI